MGEEEKQRFSAFVSYSHADKKAAQRLHRRLEGYRLPKHVAETLSDRDEPAKLGQIFRDREDLPAAEDLSTSVKAALQQSQALIVLCSPAAKASPWVAREIDLFRELHPDRPVLAALIDGEPEDAFPLPLTQAREPLAADLRKTGDGPRLGFLKIVAGIAGVPLDALVQRDAQRRVRRVTMITGGAVLAMLAMAIMTFVAIQSRNEAQVQRAEAEGLVEYMLTDLRSELKGRTTIRVMSKVNARALKYYQDQGDPAGLPADSVERRSRLLHAIGEDFEKKGDLKGALERFKEARRATQVLLEDEPRNPDRIFAHAQSEYWVGYAAWQNKDLPTTGKYWKGYLDQANALAKMEPGTVRSLMELGYSHGNLCEYNVSNERLKVAIKHCEQAIAFEKRAVKLEPSNVANNLALANRYGWMGDVLVHAKRFDDALGQREEEKQIIAGLLKADPENGQLLLRRAAPDIGKGHIESARGRPSKAISHLTGVSKKLEALAVKFSSNQHIVATQIRTQMLLARTKRKAGIRGWREHRQSAQALFESAQKGATGETVRRMKSLLEI